VRRRSPDRPTDASTRRAAASGALLISARYDHCLASRSQSLGHRESNAARSADDNGRLLACHSPLRPRTDIRQMASRFDANLPRLAGLGKPGAPTAVRRRRASRRHPLCARTGRPRRCGGVRQRRAEGVGGSRDEVRDCATACGGRRPWGTTKEAQVFLCRPAEEPRASGAARSGGDEAFERLAIPGQSVVSSGQTFPPGAWDLAEDRIGQALPTVTGIAAK